MIFVTLSINDTHHVSEHQVLQRVLCIVMLTVIMLSVIMLIEGERSVQTTSFQLVQISSFYPK